MLAFRALPLVMVVSALPSLLFHWRVLPIVVKAFSRLLEKAMGIGGAVGLGAAADVFVGMVEAPLLVRPYLAQMSRSELFITMSCEMAGVAGTVMVLYASILGPVLPDAMGHILIASIVSAPAAIIHARGQIDISRTCLMQTAQTGMPPGRMRGSAYHKEFPQGKPRMNTSSLLAGCVLLAASMFPVSSPAQGEAGARQAPSCGEWVVHREKSDTLALSNASWLRGYLAGLAAGSGKNFLSATDNASIFKWMDNYCRTSPLRDLSSGGDALAAELAGKKGTPK